MSELLISETTAPIADGVKGSRKGKQRRQGQIISRGPNKWLVRVFLGRSDSTGKRKYFTKVIPGTRKDAQNYLNGKLREVALGTFIETCNDSLDGYLDKWLINAAKPRLKERTYNDYTDVLRRHVRSELGSIKLVNLRPLDIQSLYSKLTEKGAGPRVVRYVHAVLSSALKQAVQWGLLNRNPATLVQLPKQKRREMRAMNQDEISRFLKALDGDRYQTLFAFALASGMRPEEYFGLQWRDVDFENGTATVQRALIRKVGGGWYFEEPKTSQSRRTIPLPPSVIAQLKAHRRTQLEEKMRAGDGYENNDFVFCTDTGTPLSIHNLTSRHFKPALVRAGLPKTIRLYDLRHTTATLLLLSGVNPKIVSERLGHSSITLTLDVYSHVLPSMQAAASDKLESLLFG